MQQSKEETRQEQLKKRERNRDVSNGLITIDENIHIL